METLMITVEERDEKPDWRADISKSETGHKGEPDHDVKPTLIDQLATSETLHDPTPEDWDKHRKYLHMHYIEFNMSLRKIMETMNLRHGFRARWLSLYSCMI